MKKLFTCNSALLLSAAFTLFLFVGSAYAADTSLAPLSLNERIYIASRLYAASSANFAFWQNVPDFDIDATYRTYLEKVIASEDHAAFSQASIEFLAAFHNAHTAFIDMPLVQQGGALPFTAQLIDGLWVVTRSSVAELKPGAVIETINGRPFQQFAQDCERSISASTDAGARHLLFAREPGFTPYAHLFPEQFVLTLSGGQKVAVDRRNMRGAPLATEGRWIEAGKIAYIRVPSFMGPDFEKHAIDLAREYRQAKMLIIDVRGNPGGSTPSDLAALLMDRPSRWWTESTPMAMPYFRFRASQGDWHYQPFKQPEFLWPSGIAQPAKDVFTGKLTILTDAGCFSACEDFVMPFKDNHRAVIVGQTTGGSSGQPYMVDLGKGMMIMIGAKQERFPDGSRFEGVGIIPDLEVRLNIADLEKGIDTALEVAMNQLAQ